MHCRLLQGSSQSAKLVTQGWGRQRDYLLHAGFLAPINSRAPKVFYRCCAPSPRSFSSLGFTLHRYINAVARQLKLQCASKVSYMSRGRVLDQDGDLMRKAVVECPKAVPEEHRCEAILL